MSDRHLVVGAGPVGRHVAQLLAARGSEVVVATRSGTDTGLPGVVHVSLDAADPDALAAAADGASVIYNCVNPGDYTRWETVWPPVASSLLAAAERSGAVYAITGTLYPYGPVDGSMREGMPDAATDHKGVLRAAMWADALALHEQGRIRAVEVRGSDYVGPGVGANGHVTRQLPGLRAGKRAWVIGRADVPHSFTDVLDVARLLVAAAEDASAHGRVWHVPSNPARTQRQVLTDMTDLMGLPAPKVSAIPRPTLATLGLAVPLMREINQLSYQWTRPYVLDDAATRAHFSLQPTPWDDICRRTVEG
ncbi:NAD-dependent epimerase/dehydratase family protein [Aeromicrobium endophyticum]|uniref:NAD-dependent epimerase/dehydratase family protein n=1 Tax=Aeromicrobium endophyticum TaxID=2292704 RepID=A0A371P4Q5_9ACTN|nr:NAD-dependent epimerase/dehydratase family protein [Aeromicrobium endophyticum]REK70510.1 NAD-dependent epimerase/dehydratase family protein [Aeromicrobium endophyticum]